MTQNSTHTEVTNPFPGLRPFREDEEHLFFGRESQVDAMVDKLAKTRFLAVVGSSGSGKSSLVNCGLRLALRQGLMARAGTRWRMAQFRPGNDPVNGMADALAEDGVLFDNYESEGMSLNEIIATTSRMSKLGLVEMYEMARLDRDVNLLVVVDQFEELFRFRSLGDHNDKPHGVSDDAMAFVNLLLEAREQTNYPIYIVITMRSDFIGDCAQFPGLPEAINAGQYLVPRMTRDERRAAIAGPVAVGGAEISPVLLTRLVNDVGDNPDQLSILQHALNRTWAHWQTRGGDGPIELADYEAIGTMSNALDQHARQAFEELKTPRQKELCEKIFKALTDKASDPRGVRRPTRLETLCALCNASEDEVTGVIEVFRKPSRSFLMPPHPEPLEPQTVIDISHESLMRISRRLDRWAGEEAQSARIYQRLAETAELHRAGQAGLWQDPDLELALQWREKNQPNEVWADRYRPGFTTAMDFLNASHQERTRNARKQRLRTGASVAGVLLIALLAVVSAVLARSSVNKQKQHLDFARSATDVLSDAVKGDKERAVKFFRDQIETQGEEWEGSNNILVGLNFSDSLTALANITGDPKEQITNYTRALEVRKTLAERARKTNDKWPEIERKLANAYMNVAIHIEEHARRETKLESRLKMFREALANYLKAQNIRAQTALTAGMAEEEKFQIYRDLGVGLNNLKGLYQGMVQDTADLYNSIDDPDPQDPDEPEDKLANDLLNEHNHYKDEVINTTNKAINYLTKVLDFDRDDAKSRYALADTYLTLAAETQDAEKFAASFHELKKVVDQSSVKLYREELDRFIEDWQDFIANDDGIERPDDQVARAKELFNQSIADIASAFVVAGEKEPYPELKLGRFERARKLLQDYLDTAVGEEAGNEKARDKLEEVENLIEKIRN